MSRFKLGFIGVGHMGGALAEAACRKGNPEEVIVSRRDMDLAAGMAYRLGCSADSAVFTAENSKFIFIGVKPQSVSALFVEIGNAIRAREDRFVLVTMCAGITMERLAEIAGKPCPVIRIMPNTPVAAGAGCILYAVNELVTDEDMDEFLDQMSNAGEFIEMPEELIDSGCAVSGCGPAFVYQFIIAMASAGEKIGLDKETSLKLAEQTVLGTAKLALCGGEDPMKLCFDVCSPGGSTIEGVKVLMAGDFKEQVEKAITASFERTKELSNC